jgi:DNA-directed RNA polymerase specialized sigma subunit
MRVILILVWRQMMTDTEFAKKLYCYIFNVSRDDGDADTQGLLDVVSALKDNEQKILWNYFECDCSYNKTGEVLGISYSMVRDTMLRVKLKLRHHSRLIKISVKRRKKNRLI